MNITDIPKVRVYDGAGKTYSEGYYFEMPSRMGPGIYDNEPPKIPLSRCLVHYDQGDWNLPNYPRLSRVTPPHRFEVIATEKMRRMARDVRNAAALFSQNDGARCDRLREIADFLDCRDAQEYDASGEKEDEDARVERARKAAEKVAFLCDAEGEGRMEQGILINQSRRVKELRDAVEAARG